MIRSGETYVIGASVYDRIEKTWESRGQILGPQSNVSMLAIDTRARQSGFAQDSKVVRQCGQCHATESVKVGAWPFPACREHADDLQSDRITEAVEDGCERQVVASWFLRLAHLSNIANQLDYSTSI